MTDTRSSGTTAQANPGVVCSVASLDGYHNQHTHTPLIYILICHQHVMKKIFKVEISSFRTSFLVLAVNCQLQAS